MLVMGKSRQLAACLALVVATSALGGCATKKFVRSEVGVVNTKVTATEGRVTTAEGVLRQQGDQINQISGVARDALQRAEAANKLAEGKFNYTILLTDDAVKFPRNGAQLSAEAQSRLTALAERLKSENKNVYVEVQGHADRGEAATVGAQRAEAVRRFLNAQGVPLNRISTISYGSASPATTDTTPAGRAQNRRAVVVVLA
jgi:peptidoglycan-associated lipoprotein